METVNPGEFTEKSVGGRGEFKVHSENIFLILCATHVTKSVKCVT